MIDRSKCSALLILSMSYLCCDFNEHHLLEFNLVNRVNISVGIVMDFNWNLKLIVLRPSSSSAHLVVSNRDVLTHRFKRYLTYSMLTQTQRILTYSSYAKIGASRHAHEHDETDLSRWYTSEMIWACAWTVLTLIVIPGGQASADSTFKIAQNFPKCRNVGVSWAYLESPWDMHSKGHKHAWYWFINSRNRR